MQERLPNMYLTHPISTILIATGAFLGWPYILFRGKEEWKKKETIKTYDALIACYCVYVWPIATIYSIIQILTER